MRIRPGLDAQGGETSPTNGAWSCGEVNEGNEAEAEAPSEKAQAKVKRKASLSRVRTSSPWLRDKFRGQGIPALRGPGGRVKPVTTTKRTISSARSQSYRVSGTSATSRPP